MAKKEIRTKYIKSLVADKDAMAKVLEESTKESLSSLLDESVNKSLRQMLAESDNDSYEEEVATEQPDFNPDPEADNTDAEADNGGDINVDLESGKPDGENCEGGECNQESEGSNVWDEIEDCKDSDGEYDLRGKDIKTVFNVIKNMEPGDGLRFIKNDDDTATVETDDGDTEFVIDIESDGENAEPNDFENDMNSETNAIDGNDGAELGGDKGEGSMEDIDLGDIESDGQGDGDDTYFELELGDDNEDTQNNDMVNEGNVNLGYTDNYQKKTAMTMPNDKGEGEGDSRFDDGAPKGGANNKKRWVGHDGQNGGNPYSQKTKQTMTEETNECGNSECYNECNEEAIFEVEMDMPDTNVDEGASTITRNNAYVNSTGRNQIHNPEQDDKVRNGHREAGQKRGTGDGRGTKGSSNESKDRIAAIERRANAVLNENKELRNIASQIKQQLSEAVLINASLAKVIKLITENATSRDEKINILNRFNKVQSLNECKNLYSQISDELKAAHKVNNNNLLDKQLSEAKAQNKNMIVETNMLNQSEDLSKILDLNERLMRLGK